MANIEEIGWDIFQRELWEVKTTDFSGFFNFDEAVSFCTRNKLEYQIIRKMFRNKIHD